jgi:hypothetical protein
MERRSLMVLLGVTLLITGCGTTVANRQDREVVSVRLSATPQNAGRSGVATLVPYGDRTSLMLYVSGVPSYVTQPAGLYIYIYSGSCGNLGAAPPYDMTRQPAPGNYVPWGTLRIGKTVPVALSTLRSGDYAIVVRTHPIDGLTDIFCGNLKAAGTGSLYRSGQQI